MSNSKPPKNLLNLIKATTKKDNVKELIAAETPQQEQPMPPSTGQFCVTLVFFDKEKTPARIMLPDPPPAIIVIKNLNTVFHFSHIETDPTVGFVFVFQEVSCMIFAIGEIPQQGESQNAPN